MSRALAARHGAFGRAAVYQLDKSIVTHAHREGHLAFLIEGDDAVMRLERDGALISRYTAAAVNPWQPHSFQPDAMAGESLFLILYVTPGWFAALGPSLEARPTSRDMTFGSPRIELSEPMRRTVAELSRRLLLGGDAPAEVDALIYRLTGDCHEASWRADAVVASGAEGVWDFRVRKSLKVMERLVDDDLELESVARDVGLSRSHFFRLFKQQFGLTPNLYANTLRVEAAIKDLTTTEKSITEIAEGLSFSSQASFSRFFTQNTGIPPTSYRQVALGL